MKCLACGKQSSGRRTVLETRCVENGDLVRRRRVCLYCGSRFTTHEQITGTRKRKLSPHQIRAIYDTKDLFFSNDIARLFGLHVSTVRAIRRASKAYKQILSETPEVFDLHE